MRKGIWILLGILAVFWWVIWCAVFYIAGRKSGATAASEASPPPVIPRGVAGGPERGELVSRLPARREDFTLSKDELHVSYIQSIGSRRQVVVDGIPGELHQDIAAHTFVFSPDGKHFAYAAIEGESYRVVVDGRDQSPYPDLGFRTGIVFSPDSQHVAYFAHKKDQWFAVLDGFAGGSHEGAGSGSIVFSPDSQRLAYTAGDQQKWKLIIEGREYPAYDQIMVPEHLFSPDSQHVSYAAKTGEKWQLAQDDQKPSAETYDDIEMQTCMFSPDSKRYAYAGRIGDKWQVITDGKVGPLHHTIGATSLVFSKDSRRFAYVAMDEAKNSTVFVDGADVAHFERVGAATLTFSPDSSQWACLGRRDKLWSVMVNGKALKWYSNVGAHFAFSPDGKRIGYSMYNTTAQTWCTVVDDETLAACEEVSWFPTFSKDSRHFAYRARRGGREYVVIDHTWTEAYDEVITSQPVFNDAGKVEFLVLDAGELRRVQQAVP